MSTVAEVVRQLDRRSRHFWENPRLGGEVYWPPDQSWLVYVPAGRFLMGSGDEDLYASDDEKPQHEVELSAFWLQRTPVTNAQYAQPVAAAREGTGAAPASPCELARRPGVLRVGGPAAAKGGANSGGGARR